MANTAAIATSMKAEFLRAEHNLSSSGGHTLRFALYYSSGSLGASTTAYSTTAEVTGTNYVAKGPAADMTNNPTTTGTVGYWTPGAAASWGTLSASNFDATLLFNDTHASNAALAVYTFGNQTVTDIVSMIQTDLDCKIKVLDDIGTREGMTRRYGGG